MMYFAVMKQLELCFSIPNNGKFALTNQNVKKKPTQKLDTSVLQLFTSITLLIMWEIANRWQICQVFRSITE